MSNISHTVGSELVQPRQLPLLIPGGFGMLAAGLDILVIVCASIAAGVSYHLVIHDEVGQLRDFLTVGGFVAAVFVGLRAYDKRYLIDRIDLEKDRFKNLAVVWNVAFLCLFAVGFMTKETNVYSRGATFAFYAVGAGALTGTRLLLWMAMRRGFERGWFVARRVFLYGTRARVAQFLERYRPRSNGLQVVGVWYLPEDLEDGPGLKSEKIRENLRQAISFARRIRIDDVFVVAPWSARGVVTESTEAFLAIPASIHLTPERHLDSFSDLQISHVGRAPCLRLARPPLSSGEFLAKRLLDIVLSSVGLIVLWPLFLLIGCLIRLESDGPVFFLQRRHGFNEEEFRIRKFRTMTCLEDGPLVRQASKGDARVTRIGSFLRRWNLDELPQLVNVLKGDMSIVGPRPHALVHNEDFACRITRYVRRHNVKPGITGWAQVNGFRGETDTNEKMRARVEHDLYYIANWSIPFDIYIILMTLFSRRVHRNAH
jgi:Undecaprenyl-phosphate glucose phosphotransferase